MNVTISSTFDLPFEKTRQLILKPSTMQTVASPLLQFTPKNPATLPEQWQPGETYRVQLSSLTVLPLGWYDIKIDVEKDEDTLCVGRDLGTGQFVNIWDHVITIKPNGNKTHYTDSVDVHAGLLTPLVFIFAHIFYRHRQRKWRRCVVPAAKAELSS